MAYISVLLGDILNSNESRDADYLSRTTDTILMK